MRADLERMQLIEQYLDNELSPEDRAGFESQLKADMGLRTELELQRDIQGGISRAGIRSGVKQAGRRFHGRRLLTKSLIGGAAAVVIGSAGFWSLKPAHRQKAAPVPAAYTGTALPELNEAGTREWATADSMIPAQVFNIDARRDTVIRTKAGMVLAIRGGSFVDGAGREPSGTVSLCLKEVLDAATIMTAGLSTMSDGKLLETGGMFFVDARNADGMLNINPARPVYAEIPSKKVRPGMMLFKGQRLPDGGINWTDPKPLPKDLMPVPVESLDFYPPDFLPLLAKHGYPISDRRFTDSVYYSMAAWAGLPLSTGGRVNDSVSLFRECGVNPAKIRAIRSAEFENTLVATREFAQRLRIIHDAHMPRLLDYYLDNADRNLYEIDSMVGDANVSVSKTFRSLAALRLGKVRNGSKQFGMLRDFYVRETTLFTEAVAKMQQSVRAKQAARDRAFQQQRDSHYDADLRRSSAMSADELVLNLESAYRQLGYKNEPRVIIDPITTAASIPSTGWYNVDKYVMQATMNRESMRYTDPASGKQAILRYEALDVSIADEASYNKLLVYLLPDKLSSFMRLEKRDGRFSAKLNALMQYDLVCLAYRGDRRFIHVQRGIKAGKLPGIGLKAADSADFGKQLSLLRPVGTSMSILEDAAFERLSMIYAAELKRRSAWETLLERLRDALFPCLKRPGGNSAERSPLNDPAPIPETEWQPAAGQ